MKQYLATGRGSDDIDEDVLLDGEGSRVESNTQIRENSSQEQTHWVGKDGEEVGRNNEGVQTEGTDSVTGSEQDGKDRAE